MTTFQKVIKYLAMAFAIFLIVTILGGILSAIGLFGGIFTGDAVTDEMKSYSVNGIIQDLDIEIHAADLSIKEGDTFSVQSNLKHLKVEVKDGTLHIEETEKRFGKYEGALLTVYVPAGTVFEQMRLITGAGRLTVESLSAKEIHLVLGAGDGSIGTLIATESAKIDGGTGRITVSGGSLRNLDLDMGVGQLNLRSALRGDCRLDMGIGASNLTLIGTKDDYKLDLEKGLGSISIDGEDGSHYGGSGNGSHKVEVDGGIGAINIRFEKENAE